MIILALSHFSALLGCFVAKRTPSGSDHDREATKLDIPDWSVLSHNIITLLWIPLHLVHSQLQKDLSFVVEVSQTC